MKDNRNERDVPVILNHDLTRDAHAAFRKVRRVSPLARLETGEIVVLWYDHVVRLGGDPRLQATGTAIPEAMGITEGPLHKIFEYGMLTANAETHARRRLPIGRALAGQLVQELRNHARSAADKLIETFREDHHADLGARYADLLPSHTLASIVGLPGDVLHNFEQDVAEMNRFLHLGPEVLQISAAAAVNVKQHLDAAIKARRLAPQDDFLSCYIAEADENGLSPLEAAVQLIQLIMGGTESVRASIVAQIAHLLSSPAHWKKVAEDEGYARAAIAESLRLEPGIAGSVRVAYEDVDLNGWTIPAGSVVILSTMSAMRDEAVFEMADSFDPFRTDAQGQHLAFGVGSHRCVAERFAMVELEESLRALATAFPNMTMLNQPKFAGHVFIRSATACLVSW